MMKQDKIKDQQLPLVNLLVVVVIWITELSRSSSIARSLSIFCEISLALALVASMLSLSSFVFLSINTSFSSKVFWVRILSSKFLRYLSSPSNIFEFPYRILIFYWKIKLIMSFSAALSSNWHLCRINLSISIVFSSDFKSYGEY